MQADPRTNLLSKAQDSQPWDIIVIGGGATGLATAWDACSRGLRTALIEANDFAEATSSRSTKLIHGGVRYLQKGEVSLVREALQERSLLLHNAPEFCRPIRFALPAHAPLARYYYRFGMLLYDLLAGDQNIQPAELLNSEELADTLPSYHMPKAKGGIAYTDGQFDDAALALATAQCINHSGNLAINHVKCTSLTISNKLISGITVQDKETEQIWEMKTKCVINATGIFADQFRKENNTPIQWKMQTSRGSHIVCPGNLLGSNNALIIPKTQDGRVLFAIPWKNHTIIGTTDEPTDEPILDPQPTQQEIDFITQEAQRAFPLDPSQITATFAGLRPLVSKAGVTNTSKLSRKHIIGTAPNGLISILGGKWTTARRMGQDTIDKAIKLHNLDAQESKTHHLKLTEHGAHAPLTNLDQAPAVEQLDDLIRKSHENLYARTPEDILSRRLRTSFLNQQQSQDWYPKIQNSLTKLRATPKQDKTP